MAKNNFPIFLRKGSRFRSFVKIEIFHTFINSIIVTIFGALLLFLTRSQLEIFKSLTILILSLLASVFSGLTLPFSYSKSAERPNKIYYYFLIAPVILMILYMTISHFTMWENEVVVEALNLQYFVTILVPKWGGLESSISPTLIVMLSAITYDIIFITMLERRFNKVEENKKTSKTMMLSTVGTLSFSLVLALLLNYNGIVAEIEYAYMQSKFQELQFDEELDDYNFYRKTPFLPYSELAQLDETPTLTFDNVDTNPYLDGATAFYPLYSSFVENIYTGLKEFKEKTLVIDFINPSRNEETKYDDILSCTKTSTAYSRLLEKKVDMIFAFEPSQEQVAQFSDAGEELVFTRIGYDAFTFFVSTENKVDSLTLAQIQKMYTGEIRNWRKVGGANKRVFAFQRPSGSGSQTIMENQVMQGLKIDTQIEAHTVRTMGGMINVIGGYLNADNAIGYTFMYYSSNMVTSDVIKYIAINGVHPTPESVRTGDYMFSTPFYAITLKSNTKQEVTELKDWIVGPQGQELLVKTGYVPL